MDQPVKNHGVRVTIAALGVNLALGTLYSWSVIKKAIPEAWGWTDTDKIWPYAVAVLVFAFMMVPAGRLQDKIGPRLVSTIGGLLVALGMIVASLYSGSVLGYVLGFGLLAGTGIGFGYASATPPAVKWFPAARTGMIAGIVVSGFGLASVYAAPLINWLNDAFTRIGGELKTDPASWRLTAQQVETLNALFGAEKGLPWTLFALGVGFLIVVVGLSQLLVAPPKGYVPPGAGKTTGAATKKEDFAPSEMLATAQFYLVWFMYACGAGAGLMIISSLATIGKEQAGYAQGFVLVASMAVGNGAGRIIAGMVSDKLGRRQTLFGCFLIQAALMMVLSLANNASPGDSLPVLGSVSVLSSVPALMALSALIGANYGANLSIFPSVTKDYYGLKNFGVNYGLVFTAWGVGGLGLSLLAGWLRDAYGHYYYSYYIAAGLLVLAALVVFAVKPPHVVHGKPVAKPDLVAAG